MTKVLYIAGWGRSGSTILDNVLGQVEGFFSAGELLFLWRRGLLEGRLCGCGEPVRACDVWTRVLDRAFPGGVDPQEMLGLEARSARTRHLPLQLAHLEPRGDEYGRRLGALYGAIESETGCRVIVDSSKSPAYGHVLANVAGLDVRVVHLVRDPRAVAYSWVRKKLQRDDPRRVRSMRSHGPAMSSLYWNLLNESTRVLWRGSGKHLLVRYEDFVDRPQETVDTIVDFVGEAPAGLPWTTDGELALDRTHTVSGNPSRFDHGTVALRADVEWERSMRARDRRVVDAITLPFRRRYGYR
ncbi:MAG: sulfotransferase [Thermoleophilia bacterium]|nr:sulfotransferase [Thermoleophilia bacterium]